MQVKVQAKDRVRIVKMKAEIGGASRQKQHAAAAALRRSAAA